MTLYELGIIGGASPKDREALIATIGSLVEEFGLELGRDIVVHDKTSVQTRNRHVAFAATYFGIPGDPDAEIVRELIQSNAPIIPTVSESEDFRYSIPPPLQPFNGLRRRSDDPQLTELAVAMLECVGLLRRQRRVFISYRRNESRVVAIQLHDQLTARGFDVFLDTHDIRPGEPFQEILWHRLCDSDVMVMLDTPGYFDSTWTRQELGRARAKEIHVLRVIWPAHIPNRLTDLSETVYLDQGDLGGEEGPLCDVRVDQIILAVESLRSRSIASRYMSITGYLKAEVEKIGAVVDGIGAHRAIAIRLINDQQVWAYPVVGIPTAELLNDVATKARGAQQKGLPILVYDHVGIRQQWSDHLQWLDENITAVRAIKVREAAWALAGLGE